jgi:hypothetical protein
MALPGCESVTKFMMNWDRSQHQPDANPTLKRFERWMIDHGYRDASIDNYIKAIRLYLKILKTITPSIEDAKNIIRTWRHRTLPGLLYCKGRISFYGASRFFA